MAQELDYIKVKVGQEKATAYNQDLQKLVRAVEQKRLTNEQIIIKVSESVNKMTQDLKLSTNDKKELINKVALDTAKTINPLLDQDQKILDTKKFTQNITQEMKKLQPKSISKSAREQASRLGEIIKEAKNTFVKKVQDINPLKKKEGPGR